MGSGGRRNRSGPTPDPNSGRSDGRGYSLKALPSQGFDGPVPDFPLPNALGRELDVWAWAWSTPQACAWSMPSESWRVPFVADWVRVTVRAEALDAPASLFAAKLRLEDRIGFSTAGLAEMGWAVAVDEVAARASERSAGDGEPPVRRERRLRVAGSGGA